MSGDANGYDVTHITVLQGREAIRKRPGMYVGSTREPGLHQAVFEVVGRAVNEVLASRAGSVDVTLTPGCVSVADDGPGVPVEAAGDEDGPGLEALLTHMHPRARPGRRTTKALSLPGIGPCVTNALSSRLTAEVRRDGTRWVQEYTRGLAVAPPTAEGPASGSGTTITFRPDPGIFHTVECSFAVLAGRFRELAFLNPDLDISLTEARSPDAPRSVRFRFPGGVRDFVAFLDAPTGTPVHPDVIAVAWEDPRMAGRAELALRWSTSREERIRSFANSRPTPVGGTHAAGFRDGLVAAVNAYACEHRLLTASDPGLGADRIGEGLTAVVSVKLDHPEFEGATHGALGNPAVRPCVEETVREHLGRWLEEHLEQAAAVTDRIIGGPQQQPSGNRPSR
ncbi:ATP-binding protein [Streptomyces sp. NBC_01476]|uniref:ATP-binding protein n=1 Tax=Streptomyces sp. NBC_01476 TaxID=2903881 RepID=UPI002E301054|nr:ATP-binding protein [Streptomyces sp. NBC_01476]